MASAQELDLAPPVELQRPLWKSLVYNFRDRFLPDQGPPLYLTSRPINLGMLVEVGELIADSMARPWWRSLLRSLADAVAPEKLPPLEITWEPANAIMPSQALLLTSWSNVIHGPKIFLPDPAKTASAPASPGLARTQPLPALPDAATVAFVYDLERDMLKDLRRSRRRERFLIAIFVGEIIVLLVGAFWHH